MQRFLSTFLLGILLSTSILPQLSLAFDPAMDDARPAYTNYFPSAVFTEDASGLNTVNVLSAAKSTTATFDFAADQLGEVLYVGLQSQFDGLSIEFLDSLSSGGSWELQYSKTGGNWGDFSGASGVSLTDMREEWARPSDWAPIVDGGVSMYFVRLVILNEFPADITVEQIGLTNYNLVFTAKDQTGVALNSSLDDVSFLATEPVTDGYFAYNELEDRANNEHAFALETKTYSSISYTYTLSIDGYVAETGTASVSKEQVKKDATFDFAYVATLVDADGDTLTGASVTAGSEADTCRDLGSGRYGCPVGVDEVATLRVEKNGYRDLSTTFTSDRNEHTDAQVTQTFTLAADNDSEEGKDLRVSALDWEDDGDLIMSIQNRGDEDVTAGFDFEIEVDGDELYTYEIQDDGDVMLVREDGITRNEKIATLSNSEISADSTVKINLGDDILTDEEETYEVRAEVDTNDDIDEYEEDNNEMTEDLEIGGDSSSDGVDLSVEDIQLQDDNDLIIILENIGDEDVPSSKTVITRIYVDGDLEESFSTTNKTSTDSFLDAGEREVINLGDDIVNEDDNSFTVRVVVDATDVVDEDSESNNTRTEDEDDLDTNEGGDIPECDDYDSRDTNFRDINGHFAECEVAFLYEEDVVNGITSTTFGPSYAVTRAEFLKMALLGAGYDEDEIEDEADGERSPFRDVRTYDWFHDYIVFAENEGLVDGYRDGTFKPNGVINRAEALQMIMTIFDSSVDEYESKDNPFYDIRISDWFFDVVLQGYEDGIVEGYANDYYRPSYAISRGETAALIFRAMDVYGDASTGSRSNDDEIDLKVLDLKFNDGGNLEIKLTNLGDEDVDSDERVYITVFVDGDEQHEFYKTNSSSSSFLNGGKEQTLIVQGDELDLDDDEEYSIKVEVDSKDDIDEESESNNTRTEELTYRD